MFSTDYLLQIPAKRKRHRENQTTYKIQLILPEEFSK